MNRRRFLELATLATAGIAARPLPAGESPGPWRFEPEQNLIPAPRDPALWPAFRQQLAAWRDAKRAELNYSDGLYRQPAFAWAARDFTCYFLMLNDALFLDPRNGDYTVARFLEHLQTEFGGADSVVLWHAYPRLGLDDRNQFDFYRDQPGGLAGLRRAVDELHRAGVRVFLNYNPWDTRTRREPADDLDALAAMIKALDADGLFLDTLDRGAEALRPKLDAVRPGTVLEGEIALPLERIRDHHLSWAQWFDDSEAPGVLRNKWFEPRHLQHQIRRWDRDHTGELHTAWMNGSGVLVWENIFGTWNGWCERDKSILRILRPIQRRYAALFTGGDWTPLVPTRVPGLYASLWAAKEVRVWTLVNRTDRDVQGVLLDTPFSAGEKIWDVIIGESAPIAHRERIAAPAADEPPLPVTGFVPARGIGCFVAGHLEAMGEDFAEFLKGQREILKRANWKTKFPERKAVLVAPLASAGKSAAASAPPAGMAAIPGGRVRLKTVFRIRECGFYDATHPHFNTHFPALHQPIAFEREVELKPFALDPTPVTNAQFAAFLKASGYQPAHRENFLKHWVNGAPPPGREDHPVVYVDLGDARAYARWAGKRLPTDDEWQFAAQGTDGRRYPWGNELQPGRCNGGETGGTTPVTAFPEGRSPFGCYDLCGNVWEWTESERSDGRTRFAILRGGSSYRRGGSEWYFDEGPQPCDFAAKMLLSWPGLDRCANVGFRCAVDLAK